MAMGDTPHIAAAAYASQTYGMGDGGLSGLTSLGGGLGGLFATNDMANNITATALRTRSMQMFKQSIQPVDEEVEEVMADKATTRFVRVLIVDPNENIPLQDRLIFSGTEKLTDLNDQELFFELDIKDLLATHNEKRIKVVDKAVKERTQYLEAAKIRDLRMVVTTIASF